jgi:hypothetical protein
MLGTFSGLLTIAGIQMQANISRDFPGGEGHEPIMPAGQAGALSTRTGDAAGVVTLADGHGLITGDKVAVSWTDADGLPCMMYGFEATVAGNNATIALDAGEYQGEFPEASVLPAEDYEVVVCKKTVSNFSIDKDDLTMLGVDCDQPAVAIFGGAAAIYPVQISVANAPVYWDKASGAAKPLGSDPTKVVCYNGGIVEAKLQYAVLLDT